MVDLRAPLPPPALAPRSAFNSNFSLATCDRSWLTSTEEPANSWLMVTLFLIFRARLAYFKVLSVSRKLESEGETHAIISVCELPPSESCSSRVSLESLYGMWTDFLDSSPNALMTLPSASRPELMEMPSRARLPSALVRFNYRRQIQG